MRKYTWNLNKIKKWWKCSDLMMDGVRWLTSAPKNAVAVSWTLQGTGDFELGANFWHFALILLKLKLHFQLLIRFTSNVVSAINNLTIKSEVSLKGLVVVAD